MPKISVYVITLNEEKNLPRCLNSVSEIADEIIVVDSFSTDKTEEIATSFNAKFFQRPYLGDGDQKHFAVNQTSNDWVLNLDADECLSPELINTIKNLKFDQDGYLIPILANYGGQWVRYCGWYPGYKLRLFNKQFGNWNKGIIHEGINFNSSNIKKLKGDILHYSYSSITDHITKTNRYTTNSAKAYYQKGKRSNLFKILTRPILQFIKEYFLKLGFLDGRLGFTVCRINALSAFLKYSKLRDLQMGKKID